MAFDVSQTDPALAQFAPQNYRPMVSHVAATGVRPAAPQPKKDVFDKLDEKTGLPASEFILGAAESGLTGGPLSMIAGVPISFFVADRTARKKLEGLTEQFRDEIAKQYSIAPETVTPQTILIAARDHPGLQQAIQTIYMQKDSHPKVNAMGMGGMAAGMAGGLGLASMLFGPPGWIIGGIASMGGMFAGTTIGTQMGENMFGVKDERSPMFHIEKIHEKRQHKKPISTLDIFALRVSQNKNLQAKIKYDHNEDFFHMSEGQQRGVMGEMLKIHEAFVIGCMQDAKSCARPDVNPDQLMFGALPSPVAEFENLQQRAGEHPGKWSAAVRASQMQSVSQPMVEAR